MLPAEEGKTKKDSEDDKSVSSNKSAKTIKSPTKQVKSLKKSSGSALQSHQEDSDDSSLSSVEGDTHFQYAYAAIATTHPEVSWLSSPIKHGIWIYGVCGSYTISLPLTYVATLISLTSRGMQNVQWTCQVMEVDIGFPRNVKFLVMISGFGSLNEQ